jgi:3-phosphoshikimate 1-carboxyvinyltransferase
MEALKTELRKLGYLLTDSHNSVLEWAGERCEPEPHPVVQTYEDHRMAMAFAPFALARPQGIEIADPGVVSKSYPAFWNDLKTASFQLEELKVES